MWLLINCCFLLLALSLPVQAEEPIYVYGKAKSERQHQRAGHSLSIRDTDGRTLPEWIQNQASLFPSRQSVSPFERYQSLRIRGHESRATAIYLNHLPLFDPLYTSDPPPTYDLKAIGRAEFYYGASSPDLPTVTTAGGLRYILPPHLKEKQEGTIGGNSLGDQHSSLLLRKTNEENFIQIYGREFKTSGDFPYYHNNGTPTFRDDDRLATRQNNDRVARNVFPMLSTTVKDLIFQILHHHQHESSGLPSFGGLGTTSARSKSRSDLTALTLTLNSITTWTPEFLLLKQEAVHQTTDSAQDFLTRSPTAQRTLQTAGLGFNSTWQTSELQIFHQFLYLENKTHIREETHEHLQRKINKFYQGMDWEFFTNIHLEWKSSLHQLVDHQKQTEDHKNWQAWGHSLAFAYHQTKHSYWLQQAWDERLPALIDSFGDGRYILANSDLDKEYVIHREVGTRRHYGPDSLMLAFFHDIHRNKIVYLPTLPSRVKAQNLDHTSIYGTETSLQKNWAPWSLQLSYTFLNPQQKIPSLLVPLVSQHHAIGVIKHEYAQTTLQLTQRYRSHFFRDRNNKIVHPAQITTDLHYFYNFANLSFAAISLRIGIINLFNLVSTTYTDQGEKHTLPYSELYGHPLPGRFGELSLQMIL